MRGSARSDSRNSSAVAPNASSPGIRSHVDFVQRAATRRATLFLAVAAQMPQAGCSIRGFLLLRAAWEWLRMEDRAIDEITGGARSERERCRDWAGCSGRPAWCESHAGNRSRDTRARWQKRHCRPSRCRRSHGAAKPPGNPWRHRPGAAGDRAGPDVHQLAHIVERDAAAPKGRIKRGEAIESGFRRLGKTEAGETARK